MSVSAPERLSAEERQALTEVTASFAHERVAPRSPALDRGDLDAFDECWMGICYLGLDRAVVSADLGGPGLAPSELLWPLRELAWGDAGVALCVLLSNAALLALPAEEAAAIPEGERWCAVPIPAAPAPGSDALRIGGGERPRLDGSVLSALGAAGAGGIVLLAGSLPDRALVVERGLSGHAKHPTPSQMGLRSAVGAELEFAGSRPREARAAGAARILVLRGVAALAQGVGRRAYELALSYAEVRHQGGAAIVEHGAVRSLLAGMAERLRAGSEAGSESPAAVGGLGAALAAKARASDDALAIATDAVQVLGGTGYTREAGVEKLMRDARYLQLFPEPNWVARDRLLELERSLAGVME
jgi:cyclohex-1-ene-1-carbonyl-CoA dehydrogenase